MKNHFRTHDDDDVSISVLFMEILHEEGIESAQAWLKGQQLNERYDRIEEYYVTSGKIRMTN